MGLIKKEKTAKDMTEECVMPDIVALQTEATGGCCPAEVMPKTGTCTACAGAAVATALSFKRQAKRSAQKNG